MFEKYKIDVAKSNNITLLKYIGNNIIENKDTILNSDVYKIRQSIQNKV